MTYPQADSGREPSGNGRGAAPPHTPQSYGPPPQNPQPRHQQRPHPGSGPVPPGHYGRHEPAPPQSGPPQSGSPQSTAPPGRTLPAGTRTVLIGTVAGLGILMIFLGFLNAESSTSYNDYGGYTYTAKVFESWAVGPYLLLAVAGVVCALTFLLGSHKWVAGAVAALTVVSVLVTVFQFASGDDNGAGMVMLLICALLSAVAAVIWVLIEAGHLKESGAAAPARPGVSGHGH
ncbi:DUF5336 domain-containing protein [Gordonia sp. VNK21]|uniref:DUF5336 domain-containing protein n=1 Tax=Gordonia sp. VNK21 TaxID=3382483 RepID=UPI0038D450EA